MPELAWVPAFVCPRCGGTLAAAPSGALGCAACGIEVPLRERIYRFLPPERLQEIAPFVAQYRRVRADDGYRPVNPAYYRSLPDVDPRDPQAATWRIRRESFRHLCRRVLPFMGHRPLRILDLGAGNGWLCHRLTVLGHACVAVDRLDDTEDGLGAVRHYRAAFTCLQADFDGLPLAAGQFDLAIFNASLHYSSDPTSTLRHARERLVPGGILVVMDSPMFSTEAAGRQMLLAREAGLAVMCGPPVSCGVGYLTESGLARAARDAGVAVRCIPSRGGLDWALRRWRAGRKHRREPARFGLWFGAWRPVSS